MILEQLCELYRIGDLDLLQEACTHPELLHQSDFRLSALYGVSSEQIQIVRDLIIIGNLESKLSDQCPYCTVLETEQSATLLSSYWLCFRGNSKVTELSIQELSNGAIIHQDELHLIQIIELINPRYSLFIRSA